MSSQTAQTAAVVAGTQARVAAQTTADAESHAISAATGGSQVMADAAKGAAGAYSALAGIPIVGPVLGAAAAGVTFAAIAAFEGLASSAGGDWDVDQTRLNIVHPRETIMPASVASPMRDFFSNGGAQGGSGGGGGDTYHITIAPQIQAIDGASVQAFFNKHGTTIAKTVSSQLQRNNSLRGNY